MSQPMRIRTLKPRNPFAVAACRRAAGPHRASNARQRQQGQQALRRELHQAAGGRLTSAKAAGGRLTSAKAADGPPDL